MKKSTYESAIYYQRIGKRAVRKAIEENKQKGLPNVFSKNGKIY